MGQFQIDKKVEGDTLVLALKGSVDEDAVLGGVQFDNAKTVIMDLEKITAINSCGIREWIKWLKSMPAEVKLTYRQCPKVIVDQINMVAGFLPPNGSVESFFVPYFNEESGAEKMILFRNGEEFKEGNLNPPAEVKDEKGQLMEMDVIEAKYFKFLKKAA
jgi:hypothetical protein